jgi:hypothetical protein
MKMTRLSALNALKYLVVPAMLLVAPGAARADFVGIFAPANWVGTPDTTLLHTTSSLFMAQLTSTVDRDLTIAVEFGATWSFDYAFGSPAGGLDEAGYLINGVYTQVAAGTSSSGSVSVPVALGDTIGFRLTGDGSEVSTLTITNFEGPIPEPSTVVLMGIGAVGLVLARRRRRAV